MRGSCALAVALSCLLGCTDAAPAGLASDANAEVAAAYVGFGFPVPVRELIEGQRIGVDHDPVDQPAGIADGICTDYQGRGFPWCYDEHTGTDFLLVGGFDTMDAGSTEIVAAWPGTVVEVHDGEYDRCHIEGFDISCDGNPMVANHVIVDHPDLGVQSLYWHIKKDSILVAVGDEVACGQPLALIGSSGISSAPHLHFELTTPEGEVVDPYAGEFSQPRSYWEDQNDAGLPAAGCTAE